jgi:hypothetical protein
MIEPDIKICEPSDVNIDESAADRVHYVIVFPKSDYPGTYVHLGRSKFDWVKYEDELPGLTCKD